MGGGLKKPADAKFRMIPKKSALVWRSVQKSSKIVWATILLIAVNLGVGIYFLIRKSPEASVEITTPVLAIEALKSKSLYFTPQARPFLLARTPQTLTHDDLDAQSERSLAFAQATQNPVLWRQLDRKFHFDAVLLCGDPVTYRPLLGHLLDTGDWTLTYLDHTSLIFQRPPAHQWMPADLDAIRKKFVSYPTNERVVFLVQLAGRLSAATQFTLAKQCLDEALKLKPRSPDALTQLALYYAHFGQWKQTLETADAALAGDKNYQPALITKGQALLAMRRFDEALKVSDHLMEMAPHDPQILFLHARISHEAHAYSREIAALEVLIQQAEQQKISTSGYRIYLGQAQAASGAALPALEQFQKALAAGDLSPEQKNFVNQCVERIKSRM